MSQVLLQKAFLRRALALELNMDLPKALAYHFLTITVVLQLKLQVLSLLQRASLIMFLRRKVLMRFLQLVSSCSTLF